MFRSCGIEVDYSSSMDRIDRQMHERMEAMMKAADIYFKHTLLATRDSWAANLMSAAARTKMLISRAVNFRRHVHTGAILGNRKELAILVESAMD